MSPRHYATTASADAQYEATLYRALLLLDAQIDSSDDACVLADEILTWDLQRRAGLASTAAEGRRERVDVWVMGSSFLALLAIASLVYWVKL